MSSKINICGIINGHLSTLCNAGSEKVNGTDVFTFFVVPFIAAILLAVFKVDLSDGVVDVFVNSSAIFVGLLLNLLVLVYDQKSKIPKVNVKDDGWEILEYKHAILSELYFNISYSTLISLFLLVFSVIHLSIFNLTHTVIIKSEVFTFDYSAYITTPILVFCGFNLLFTIFMVLKRIYSLLVTENK